jgi:anti-sigma regulatory factor (Ser/Thr protein kinase)
MRSILARHIALESDIEPGLGVGVAAHRLTQAVFNLVQNAGEAMAGQPSGTVRVVAERDRPGRIVLRISDTGPGMPPEVARRCFDPYFSTKGRAIATGMGLGMVRGIAESCGGTVRVTSAPGKGTTFTLELPEASVHEATERNGGAPRAPRRRTAAVSLSDSRAAAISLMLLENLGFGRAAEPDSPEAPPPEADLWITDTPERSRLHEFLAADPSRRAVVVGELRGEPAEVPPAASHLSGRAVVVSSHPRGSELREAVRAAVASFPAD